MLTELSSKIDSVQNEVTQRLSEDIQAIKDDTEKIKDDNKEIKRTSGGDFRFSYVAVKSLFDVNFSDLIKTEVAKEHHAEIDRCSKLTQKSQTYDCSRVIGNPKETNLERCFG